MPCGAHAPVTPMHARTLLLLASALLLTAPGAAALDTDVVSLGDEDCGIICCFQDNHVDRAQCIADFFVVAVVPLLPGSTGNTVLAFWAAVNVAIDGAQKDGGDILCQVVTCPDDLTDLAGSGTA